MANSQKLLSFGDVPFASPYNVVGKEECRNLYPEMSISQSSKVPVSFVSVPGLKLAVQKSAGNACRGLYRTSDQRLFQVHSNIVDEIMQNGTRITRGYITSYSGVVNFSSNDYQMILVDGTFGYSLDLASNTFSKIDENIFPNGATHITNINSYFLVNVPNTFKFRCSYPNNGTIWNPLDEFAKIGTPEVIVAIKELRQQLWVFGTTTTEVFYDTADIETGIWKRVEGAAMDVGCAAKNSISKIENNLFWLGYDHIGHTEVYSNDGLSPVVISTRAIEQLIDRATGGNFQDAIGYSYSQDGHNFYILQFMSSNLTICYDTTTKKWHVRSNRNWIGNDVKWSAIFHQFIWGKNYFGDLFTNALYNTDMDYFYNDDSDDPTKPTYIIRERTTAIVQADQKRIRHKSFEVLLEMGVGNNLNNSLGFGSNPQVMLQTSDDSGISWSNFKYEFIGKIGETRKRAKFNRLGISRNRVYKVIISDPVKVILIGFVIDSELLGS